MKDQERDLMRKIILSALSRGRIGWTDLKKMALGSCYPFATDSTFAHQMRYLLDVGYIKKVGKKGTRSPYEMTERGKLQLSLFERT